MVMTRLSIYYATFKCESSTQRGRGGEGCGINVPKNDACQQMIIIFKIEKKRLSHSLHDL